MNELDCARLDDYLDGVLDTSQHALFQRHTQECEACRAAIAFEDGLRQAALKSNAKTVMPPRIAIAVHGAIRSSQRKRRIAWTSGLAAAIALLVVSPLVFRAFELDSSPTRERVAVATQGGERGSQSEARESSTAGELPMHPAPMNASADRAPAYVRLQSTGPPSQVAVPIAPSTKNFTLVMLYPTIRPAASEEPDYKTNKLEPRLMAEPFDPNTVQQRVVQRVPGGRAIRRAPRIPSNWGLNAR